jgi:hypothetical protein
MRRLIITVIFVTIPGLLSYTALARPVHPVQAFRLEYFPSLPKGIERCSGVYTYDSVPLQNEKYIFVDDLRNLAFVNVNGNEIELKKIKDLVFPGGKKIRTVYEGSGYKVILIVRQIAQTGVEAANLEGTLQVKFGHNNLEFKIHGRAGC